MRAELRRDKGIAGLEILLSVIVMLFVIGFVIMIFALMGGTIEPEARMDVVGSVNNETLSNVNSTVYTKFYGVWNYHSGLTCTIAEVYNSSCLVTDGGKCVSLVNGNYTTSGCAITFLESGGDTDLNDTTWNVTYSWAGRDNSSASDAIHSTTGSISGVTDWFGIIITITVMVVLILLTVIIIRNIRGGTLGITAGAGRGLSETA